jgi:hypothetical protein
MPVTPVTVVLVFSVYFAISVHTNKAHADGRSEASILRVEAPAVQFAVRFLLLYISNVVVFLRKARSPAVYFCWFVRLTMVQLHTLLTTSFILGRTTLVQP